MNNVYKTYMRHCAHLEFNSIDNSFRDKRFQQKFRETQKTFYVGLVFFSEYWSKAGHACQNCDAVRTFPILLEFKASI
jgi:hypothetical protein